MILRIVYFVLCAVIIYQVISLIRMSDKLEDSKKNEDYWYGRFYECERNSKILSEKLTEYEKMFENIKNSIEF